MALKTTYTDTFACTPAQLWPWIDDQSLRKQWLKAIEDTKPVSSGPHRPGYQGKMYIREGRKLGEYDTTLLAYEPNKRFQLEIAGREGKNMKVVVDYQLSDLRDGRTRLDYSFEVTQSGRMLKIFGPVLMFFGRLQLKRMLRGLHELAENPAASGAR